MAFISASSHTDHDIADDDLKIRASMEQSRIRHGIVHHQLGEERQGRYALR